jgi:hypothetical protein
MGLQNFRIWLFLLKQGYLSKIMVLYKVWSKILEFKKYESVVGFKIVMFHMRDQQPLH